MLRGTTIFRDGDRVATDWKVDQTESSEEERWWKGRERVSDLRITAGPYEFLARWEREKSPQTCAAFEALLPYRQKIIHVRWSGESCWIPLGDYDLGVGFEDATSVPQAGEILFYPGGYSETEILFPYSGTIFASKLGQLAGNHFLTVVEGRENLRALGELTLWEVPRTSSSSAHGVGGSMMPLSCLDPSGVRVV